MHTYAPKISQQSALGLKRVILLLCALTLAGCASGPLDGLSADERYRFVSDNLDKLVTGGRVTNIHWSQDGSGVSFTRNDQRYRYDLGARRLHMADDAAQPDQPATRPATRPSPGRGKQRNHELSPDGKWIAVCKDWNVVLQPTDVLSRLFSSLFPVPVTTDGHRKFRYGTASWVYGEELDQHEAMWWSPDSSKLVFYEFDERLVPDHHLTAGLTDLHTTILTEGYPKPGEPNPIANLLIYDLNTRQTVRVDAAPDPDWYIYAVRFALDGSQVLFNRTNRHQSVLELVAADVETGSTRTVVAETQATWQDNAPEIRFLADGHRFIWMTEKTGWKQYELRDLDGAPINTLTQGDYPVASIEHVDEENALLYYTAYSDVNPLNKRLHRVGLDGCGQKCLTQEPFNHSVEMSPDGRWFISEYESAETPPTTALYDTDGRFIATLAESEHSLFTKLGLNMPELFSFKADDGFSDLYGVLFKPSNFKRSKKYPLVIDVYGGPFSQSVRNRFAPAVSACEYGFLIARIDNRGTINRGKPFESATYLKLGEVDLNDQVDGVNFLQRRSYVDRKRTGVYGHSYGGYMAALALLKYPDLFQVAVASSAVTDWRNYDTIYTERFMRTPQENLAGYDAGSCLKYAHQLKGKLLLQHGMVDDNVHPTNIWQLVDALQKAGKSFDVMVYPNSGHSLGAGAAAARWAFLRKHLIDPSHN